LNRGNFVIFVSQFDQNLAKTYGLLSGNTPNCVIHNGIPCPSVKFGAQDQQCLIGFVGRLEPPKDPLLFLASLEELPHYRGMIIGTGSLEMTVRKEIERKRLGDRVTMRGGLSHEETMNAMGDFQLLVMTSRWEGLPLIPLEAMKIGVPVVATDVGGMREIIEDGKSGVDGARNHRGVEAVPGKRLIAGEVPIDIDGVRRPALAHDGSNFPFLAGVDQHQSFATEAIEILLQNTARQQRGHPCIEGIAAFQQNAEGYGRCERMAGGYAAGRPHDSGPKGRADWNRGLSGSGRR
jgi:hypothetical protein